MNVSEFLQQAHSKAAGRDNVAEVLKRFEDPLKAAEKDGKKDEIIRILQEMHAALESEVGEFLDDDDADIDADGGGADTPPEGAIDPFTSSDLLKNDLRQWINEQHQKRIQSLEYFGLLEKDCIDNNKYQPPSASDILAGMTPDKIELAKTFQKPLLMMTPIGVSLKDIRNSIGSKKGACAEHNPPMNFWNKDFNVSEDFDHDIRGDLVYHPRAFDKDNHQGKTKAQLLSDRTNRFKGWQVLIIEGADETPRKGQTARNVLTEDQNKKLTGLTPEDYLMLQGEGVRQGKPFEQNTYNWLTGVYLKNVGGVPFSYWGSGDSQVCLSGGGPGVSGPRLGSRPAVRIL